MKINLYLLIFTLILQSCKKNSNEVIYEIDKKKIIAHGNEKYIKNVEALELYETGLTYVENKDLIKAKEYFSEANEIEKNNVIILNSLALVESDLGNNQKSIEMLYKNISIDSTIINTYLNLGQNLMLEKKYNEANKILLLGLNKQQGSNLHQKSILFINLAVSFNNLGKCNEGLKYAKEALKISQNNELTNFANKIKLESENCK